MASRPPRASASYDAFASDLPRDRTIVFESAEENEETMQSYGVNQEVRQLGKGAFRCDMAVRSTAQADLFADRFSRASSLRLEPPPGTVGILLLRSANGEGLAAGQPAANDALLAFPDGSGSDIVIPDLGGSNALTLSEDRFNAMADALCPTPKSVWPQDLALIRGDTARLQALGRTLVDLVSEPDPGPDAERVSDLLAAMIVWMGESSHRWRAEQLTVNGARARIAKLTQEFIEENFRNTVRMEDICRVTQVGVRTLQRSYLEYFGCTISDYLKAARLDAARRALLVAHASEQSVTEIAVGHGFNHLGRFSVEFRERFGEVPSSTLARKRAQSGSPALASPPAI